MEEFLRLGGFRKMNVTKRFLPYTNGKRFTAAHRSSAPVS
jgi:hypothetical protein